MLPKKIGIIRCRKGFDLASEAELVAPGFGALALGVRGLLKD